jgi:hypothetical protein
MSIGMWAGQLGLNAGTAAINNWFNRRAQKQSFKDNQAMSNLAHQHNVDLWNRQSEWNIQQWNRQNEYNTPAAQKQRLKDAGLNPALMYGNAAAGGSAASIQQAQTPKYSPARADYSYIPAEVPNMLGMYYDMKLKAAQVDNVKEQANYAKEKGLTEALLRGGRLTGQTHDNAVKYSQAKYAQAFAELGLKKDRASLANMAQDLLNKKAKLPYEKAQAGLKEIELKWLRDKGIRPQDALWMRLLLGLGENITDSTMGRFLLNPENWKSRRFFGNN